MNRMDGMKALEAESGFVVYPVYPVHPSYNELLEDGKGVSTCDNVISGDLKHSLLLPS
jgi:hypothetical protein